MRTATIKRITGETQIELTLNLDGEGKCSVKNPIGFFDHLLTSFCKHGLFDLSGSIAGDLHVDQHHTIEDTGMVLGQCFAKPWATAQGFSEAARLSIRWTRLFCARRWISAADRFLCAMPS